MLIISISSSSSSSSSSRSSSSSSSSSNMMIMIINMFSRSLGAAPAGRRCAPEAWTRLMELLCGVGGMLLKLYCYEIWNSMKPYSPAVHASTNELILVTGFFEAPKFDEISNRIPPTSHTRAARAGVVPQSSSESADPKDPNEDYCYRAHAHTVLHARARARCRRPRARLFQLRCASRFASERVRVRTETPGDSTESASAAAQAALRKFRKRMFLTRMFERGCFERG